MGVRIMECIREVYYVSDVRAGEALSSLCATKPERRHQTIHAAMEEDQKIFDAEELKTLKYYRVAVTVEEIPLETQI